MRHLNHRDCGGRILSAWTFAASCKGIAFTNDNGLIEADCDFEDCSADISYGCEELAGYYCEKCGHYWEAFISDPVENPDIEIEDDDDED